VARSAWSIVVTNTPAARIPVRGAHASLRPGGSRFGACLVAALLGLGIAVSSEAAETYYRWKDDSGRLVVSDRPPQDPDVEYEVVSQRSTLTRRVRSGEGAVPPEVTPRPGNEFEAREAPASETENSIPKNSESCARARKNLETLNTAARIRIRDPDTGELRYLTEEDKDEQREQAMEIIRVHCE
jgi:hypothetical protein